MSKFFEYVKKIELSSLITESSNTFYYNLLTDASFNEIDFYDADHLNKIGAKKLTQKIDSLLVQNNSINY